MAGPSQPSSPSSPAGSPSRPSANTRRTRRRTGHPNSSPPPEGSSSASAPNKVLPAASSPTRHPLATIKAPQAVASPPRSFSSSSPSSQPQKPQPTSTTPTSAVFGESSRLAPPSLSRQSAGLSRSPSPAAASAASPPLPHGSPSGADALAGADVFARAQAMGLRLTREEYDRTRAGLTAFLKAERVPGAAGAARTSPLPGGSGSERLPSLSPTPTPVSGKDAVLDAASPNSLRPSSAPRSASTSRLPLSFFTAVVPAPPVEIKTRPKLDDVGNAEEKRKRKERRRRQREKMMARTSMSEPETSRTPRMSGGGSGPSSSIYGGSPMSGSSSGGVIGLGLGSSGSRHGHGFSTTTPDTSPLAGMCFYRARTLSASAFPSSSTLQAAVAEAAESTTSPGLRRLSSRAWTSPGGRLSLAERSPAALRSALSHSRSASANVLVDSDDEEEEVGKMLDADGHDSATSGGWAVGDLSSDNEHAIAKMGLLDRVMRDKGSPTRRRSRRSTRRRSDAARASMSEMVPAERVVFAVSSAPGSSASEGTMGPPAIVPASQLAPAFSMTSSLPPPSSGYTGSDSLRRRSHSRQMSQAGKSVRWAPTLAPMTASTFTPGHQRMTTRDHYEFFVNGVNPETAVDLSELEVDQQPQFIIADAAQASMPWLYGSTSFIDDGGVGSSTFRIDNSPMGRSPSRMSLTAEDFQQMTSMDFDYEQALHDRRTSVNARRGLLFGPSGTSPTHSTVNRFNPGFSDPALSQSPQRGSILSSRHTRGKSSLGSIRDLFASGQIAVAMTPERSSQASTAIPRSRASIVQQVNHPTVSPAAIFGGPFVPVEGQPVALVPAAPRSSVHMLARTSSSEALPEPTKHWGKAAERDDESEVRLARDATSEEASSETRPVGLARVRSEGTMDWGVSASQEQILNTPEVAPRATLAKSSSKPTPVATKAKAAATPAAPAPPAAMATPAPRRVKPANFGPLPPDPSILEFERPDGSKLIKLVSEELQAALDSGEFEEPPPRYYVLPPGAGATKGKPPHVSYAGLIGQAILTSSDQRLSLAEIYNWISTVHPFFERGDRGWQNSIRHNLSLNKSFIKVEREANIPGKGGWWAIKEGHEERFKDGLYSAGPGAAVEKSGGGSSSKKSKKKAGETQEAVEGPTATPTSSLPTSMPEAVGEQNQRKRQTTDGSADSNGPSPTSPSRSGGRSNKVSKKSKGSVGPASRLPLADVTNRHLGGASAAAAPANLVQYGDFFTATPARQGNYHEHYMASSGGMPTLTDSASSPPSSPAMLESDVLMPPPPSTKRKGSRRGGHQGRLSSFSGPDQQGYPEHVTGIFQQQYLHQQQQQQQQQPTYSNVYFSGNGSNASGFYPQPSPLASRWRGAAGSPTDLPTVNGSPLRRSTTSPAKLATTSPVSSMRGSASSALAGAMNVGAGSANGAPRHRRTGSGLGTSGLTSNGQSFFVHHNPFQQGMGGTRGSPVRRVGQQDTSATRSTTGATFQAALDQGGSATHGLGGMGPSIGGLGVGFHSTNITPGRVTHGENGTPKGKGGATGPQGVSPSPTTKRFHASQNQSHWLEDPFDYQGALQHELESMGGGSAGGGAVHIEGAGHPHYTTAMSGSGTHLHGAASGGPMMGLMMTANGSPIRLGGSGHNGWLSTGTQQDNVSAVRGSPEGRD